MPVSAAEPSFSPAPDSDPGLDPDLDPYFDIDSCPHLHWVEGYSYRNSDGINVYDRSEFPKKEFDFSQPSKVPKRSTSEVASYAVGDIRYIVPWCGPNSQPLKPEHLDQLRSDAQFILLTDSLETFSLLHLSGCHVRHKFFLLKGSADQCTCYFLRLLKREWRIPIVALVDYEPASVKLLSFYESWKPVEMSWRFAGIELDIKWLGLRRIHLNVAEDPLNAQVIKSGIFADMDDQDLAIAESLLNDDFVNKSEERVAEVKRMIEHKLITIVIALDGFYVLKTYLPELLNKELWI